MLGNWIGGRVVDRHPLTSTIVVLLLLIGGMLSTLLAGQQRVWLALSLALWGLAYTALFPICQVRVMQAGAKAQALAATMNISAANAGTGLGSLLGGAAIGHWGLASLSYLGSAIAVAAIVTALWMARSSGARERQAAGLEGI